MAGRRPSPALNVIALAIAGVLVWRVTASLLPAPAPPRPRPPALHPRAPGAVPGTPVPGTRHAASGGGAADSDSAAARSAAALDSSSDTTDTMSPMDTLEMNAPEGYLDQVARAQARRQLRDAAATTYLDQIVAESPDSALHRWYHRYDDPVRVYLATDTIENYHPAFQDAVRSALSRWEDVQLPVRFRFVDDSFRAEVVFRWRRKFAIDRTGQTDLTWDRDGRVLSAIVTIATFDPTDHPMSTEDVRIVALHEIGHLLGLNHSSDSTDIMFGHTMARDLSARDIRTAQLLYDLPPGSVK